MSGEIGLPLGKQLMASSLSGLLADSMVHPIECLKTRLQTQDLFKHKRGFTNFTSPLDALIKTWNREGARALYRGFGAVGALTPLGYSIYFSSYDCAKHVAETMAAGDNALTHFAAGASAQMFSAVVFVPMDIIKQRCLVQQVHKNSARKVSAFKMGRDIIKSEGIAGVYRGYSAAMLCFAPHFGLYFVFYEKLREAAAKSMHTDVRHLPFYTYLLCSGISGATAAWLTNPLDVLKTRIQVQSKSTGTSKTYKSSLDGLRSILRTEGPRALFHGAVPRSLWLGTSGALSMMFYEKIKTYLHDEVDSVKGHDTEGVR